MRAKLQEPYKLLSGRLENVVNFPIEKRPMVRDMVIPYNPKTPIQEQIRTCFAEASSAFNTISDSQRILWHNYAKKIMRTNSLGQIYSIPDKSLFVQVNLYRRFDGKAITLDCPTQEPTGIITDVPSITCDGSILTITIESSPEVSYFLIEMSNALPGLQRQARKNELFLVSTILSDNIVPRSSGLQKVQYFHLYWKFPKSIDDRVCIKITPLNSGYVKGMAFKKNIILETPPITTSVLTGSLDSNEPNYASFGAEIQIWNSDNTILLETIYPSNNATSWESSLLPAGDYNLVAVLGLYENATPPTYDNVTLFPPDPTTGLNFYFENEP
jgi:hypothetical protein